MTGRPPSLKTHQPCSTPIDAVVGGYLCVDMTPQFGPTRKAASFAELFRPGKLIEVDAIEFSLGGAVANTGLAMKKFGLRVALMGSVGVDALGDLVASRLAEQGVTQGLRRNDQAGTAYSIVIAPPGLDRLFLENPGCNSVFTSADIDYAVVAESRLFHFGYPSLMNALWANGGTELRELLRRARDLNVATSLDMALPDPDSPSGKADWQDILSAALPLVDIFVPSIEEILYMLEPKRYAHLLAEAAGGDMIDIVPQDLYEQLADRMLGMGVKILLIKAGHRGAYLRTGALEPLHTSSRLRLADREGCPRGCWIPTFPVDKGRFCNACGAGDCAVAAFLTALLKGVDVKTAGVYAMMAGRDNLYGKDALAGLSDWSQMTQCVRQPAVAGK